MMQQDLKVHQVLHGYSNGHSLLAASTELSNESRRALSILSDLSGHISVPAFSKYITGYPLIDSEYYVLAQTWYATEMPRPGCVWTHSLLLSSETLKQIDDLSILKNLFLRPTLEQPLDSYRKAFLLNQSHFQKKIDTSVSAAIVESIYTQSQPLFLITNDPTLFEDIFLSIWSQQWNCLRGKFAFCSGALSNIKIGENAFDLQAVPYEAYRQIKREMPYGKFIEPDTLTLSHHAEWVVAAAAEIENSTFRQFRSFATEILESQNSGREMFEVLFKTYLLSKSELQFELLAKKWEEIAIHIAINLKGSNEARGLKKIIFGRNGILSKSEKQLSERYLLRFLVETDETSFLDGEDLLITQRSQDLWREDRQTALELSRETLTRPMTPIRYSFIEGAIIEAEIPDLLALFGDLDPIILGKIAQKRPQIMEQKSFWQNSTPQVRASLYTLEQQSSALNLTNALVAFFESQQFLDRAIVPISLREKATYSLLEHLSSHQPAKPLFDNAWLMLKGADSTSITKWITSKGVPSTCVAALVCSYGLECQKEGAFFVELTFETLNQAIMRGSLDRHSLSHLEERFPSTSFWRSQDKSALFRSTILRTYAANSWSPESFIKASRSNESLHQLLEACKSTYEYKKYWSYLKAYCRQHFDKFDPSQQEVLKEYFRISCR